MIPDWLWITLLVLGVVVSNIMLLKHTANIKMPHKKDPASSSKPKPKNNQDNNDAWDDDDWDD